MVVSVAWSAGFFFIHKTHYLAKVKTVFFKAILSTCYTHTHTHTHTHRSSWSNCDSSSPRPFAVHLTQCKSTSGAIWTNLQSTNTSRDPALMPDSSLWTFPAPSVPYRYIYWLTSCSIRQSTQPPLPGFSVSLPTGHSIKVRCVLSPVLFIINTADCKPSD